jgi:integrase
MRLGEALELLWSDIDLSGRAIHLRDAKSGARTVHLGAAAVSVLDSIEDKSGYVIRGLDPARALSINSAEKNWRRLRDRAGILNGRLHDLRHTAGTFAALAGGSAFVVRDLLGHKTLAMTGRYVERAADMVRATVDAVSARVAAALDAGTAAPGEVIKLPKSR